MKNITNNTRVVDLFSGGGGLSLGFQNAGFHIMAAFDNWDSAIELYKRNFDHPIVKCDLGSAAKSVIEIAAFSPNVIIGGPPCQDFSSAGKRDENGGRADLTISFAEIVATIKPSFFVMENVERATRSSAFSVAKRVFTDAGYGLTESVLDASKCGVPQIRKRVFVIGELGGRDGVLTDSLIANQSTKRMTVKEYFGDKLEIEHYYRHPRSYYRRAVFSVHEPSPTVRGVNRPIPGGYPGHPGDKTEINEELRSLTTRERASIQTFPEWFDLSGSKTETEQIIGNAVPVKLAEFVAKTVMDYIVNGAKNRYLF